ncbi:DMT family transporter [Alkalimarinus alittae]|uniref:DMT family transporter n=1 Tax=Alkalimarinus alittae TaxID=2961619 RepID=A0ABY6MYH2_9ALTE|nr:DMT family transporter [Alkalimarinus alittae]UZE94893.1 DMT family transporter [Alkalimarinus alittae]
MVTKQNHLYVHALMLLMVALVAGSFPVGAIITNALPPDVLMFIRFLIAATLFAPFVFYKHGLFIPTPKSLMGYALLSLPLVIFFWCMFESLRYTSPLNTGALYTTVPAITAIFAYFINKESTGKVRSIGLLTGTIGALWIVFRGDVDALLSLNLNYGDSIFLVGCLFMALYSPMIKRVYAGEPMELMTFWVILFGSGWLLLISANKLGGIDWLLVDSVVYGGVLYLSLFTTLFSFFLIQFGTVKIGPTKVAAYSFLIPVFVIPLSILLGVGTFDIATLPGVSLVIFAMILIQTNTKNIEIKKG